MSEQRPVPSAYASRIEALKLAFGPIMFQAVRVARDTGLLEALDQTDADTRSWLWLTPESLENATTLDAYGVRVLLDAIHAAGLVQRQEQQYRLTAMGHFLLHDPLTRVNLDFVHDVCYQGMAHLEEALRSHQPAGLKTLGDWETIYQGLAELPEPARTSWFNFDHYFSDQSFNAALPYVFDRPVRHLVDIGGNTGRWTRTCLAHDPNVQISLVDLPGQLETARASLASEPGFDRVTLWPADLLDAQAHLPAEADVVWMSQFLCCFSLPQIIAILRNARRSLAEGGRVIIMETFPDQQQYDIAAYCLTATSLYFTCMANGVSRLYHRDDMLHCIEQAGLTVADETHHLGMGHSLLQCV